VNYIYALNDRLYITEGNVMKSKYSDNTDYNIIFFSR